MEMAITNAALSCLTVWLPCKLAGMHSAPAGNPCLVLWPSASDSFENLPLAHA